MTTGSLPLAFDTKVKQAVAAITTAVRDHGLEDLLALELWHLRQNALTAMLDRDLQLAERVIASRYEFYRRIRAA